MENVEFQQLKQLLLNLPTGPVKSGVEEELVQLLASCWHMFSGSGEEGMEAYKLGRMEDSAWNPPEFLFTIERHGGAALGSIRAELQEWVIDMDRKEASCYTVGHRQIERRGPSVKVQPIAEEISKMIIGVSQDRRLRWSKNGHVRVLTGTIFPIYSAPKQTVEGRRRRFLRALEKLLIDQGWQCRGSWWYKE